MYIAIAKQRDRSMMEKKNFRRGNSIAIKFEKIALQRGEKQNLVAILHQNINNFSILQSKNAIPLTFQQMLYDAT